MTAQVELAEGQAFVEGRSEAKARELLAAAKEAGYENEVFTTSFGYIVPADILGKSEGEDDGEDKAKEFDPSEASVEEVHDYIKGADDAERERVLAAEREGKNRVTVLREYEGAK